MDPVTEAREDKRCQEEVNSQGGQWLRMRINTSSEIWFQ